jgi:vitamin B12/bleomycin/antimicrobial peptide transport system ATP-binding/permease protein
MSARPSLPRSFWTLLKLCWEGPGGRLGAPLLIVVAALRLASIPIGLWLIQWNADFYNALQKVDAAAAVHQIGVFAVIILASAGRFLIADYLTKHLQIRWRTALTSALLDRWLAGHTYWRIEQAGGTRSTDNPDQRIAEDARIFVDKLTEEALDVLTAIVALFTYIPLLWSLSNFPLQFSLFGVDIVIHHYMVWAAPIYVALSTAATHFLGAPLLRLTVEQQHREADFRFSLARAREYAEPIALTGGERAERTAFQHRYGAIVENFHRLINRNLILGLFTRPYMQTVLQIPTFLALPAFLAGQVTLGGLMQLRSAFQQVVTNLSYFIFSYRDLALLAAAIRRLGLFVGDLTSVSSDAPLRNGEDRIERAVVGRHEPLSWQGLALAFPDGERRLPVPDTEIVPGAHTWIHGPSGMGKSTLVRAIGGLWTTGSGNISVPGASVMIVPQRLYIPIDGARAAAVYPGTDDHTEDSVAAALDALGLDRHAIAAAPSASRGMPVAASPGPVTLSGGEQQRLMLARLLLHKPRYAILDEPTSALDEKAETALFETLVHLLPETTFVVIAHRRPPALTLINEVHISDEQNWPTNPAALDHRLFGPIG